MQFRNRLLSSGVLGVVLCCGVHAENPSAPDPALETARETVKRQQERFAPDSHLAVYDVSVEKRGNGFIVSGEVMSAKAKRETERALMHAGIPATNEIIVLPAKELEDKTWGISSLSVANGREDP